MDAYTLTLKRFEEVADRTRLFVFEKPEGFSFLAGQYVAMRIPEDRLVEPDDRAGVRSFSIASAPHEDELVFVMREGISAFKKTMWMLEPGETVGCTRAIGHCTVPEGEMRPLVLLAGGVGIAPVRAILRDAKKSGDSRPFALFYSNRKLEDAAFHEEFLGIDLPDFTYIWTLTDAEDEPTGEGEERAAPGGASLAPHSFYAYEERGFITREMIERHLSEWQAARYYVIGAPGFADAMKEMLLSAGIAEDAILMDPFAGMESKKTEKVEEAS